MFLYVNNLRLCKNFFVKNDKKDMGKLTNAVKSATLVFIAYNISYNGINVSADFTLSLQHNTDYVEVNRETELQRHKILHCDRCLKNLGPYDKIYIKNIIGELWYGIQYFRRFFKAYDIFKRTYNIKAC